MPEHRVGVTLHTVRHLQPAALGVFVGAVGGDCCHTFQRQIHVHEHQRHPGFASIQLGAGLVRVFSVRVAFAQHVLHRVTIIAVSPSVIHLVYVLFL